MAKLLFLLDGMALAYRAHFAFIQRPIYTSKGFNTSALYGFTQTLLDIRDRHQPSHVVVAFDTPVPTQRHRDYPEYKAQREAMPEELAQALPHVRRLVEAFRLPFLSCDGYEADDVMGTVVRRAEPEGFECYLVTPDKDFGQLVNERVRLYRPGRAGAEPEILGPVEVCARWGIRDPRQVIDLLGLMGDSSDNIPGVPGIGEKTAAKLIAEFGSLEAVLARSAELKGKLRLNVEAHAERARLSKRLATINCEVPIEVDFERLAVVPPDEEALRALMTEFEFNALGRRLLGEGFKAGRGRAAASAIPESPALPPPRTPEPAAETGPASPGEPAPAEPAARLQVLSEVPHRYREVRTAADRAALLRELTARPEFGLATAWQGADARHGRLAGLAFALGAGEAAWVSLPTEPAAMRAILDPLAPVLADPARTKTGFDLKADFAALRQAGVALGGPLFDVMLAHALVEPDLRHSLEYLAESQLAYTPIKAAGAAAGQGELGLDLGEPPLNADAAMERADLALRLRQALGPQLASRGQGRVFYDVEMPLVPVLADMELEGIRVDVAALAEFSAQLGREMAEQEAAIHRLAGGEFNVNSPKQLGEVLFDKLHLSDKAKKTRTGQYATDEQTLLALAEEHEIVRRLLEHRACSKLKSTYADALPAARDPGTGRVHTTFHQLLTATGRLSSQNPNLQNIPIRTDRGQEIRRAFVPRGEGWALLSADYSQIELRIIAGLGREAGLLEAFRTGADVHTATAARVFGVDAADVTAEMRKQAKMVNYGIAYGISAFGLAQRLGIPRKVAAEIIEQYFAQFPGVRAYMDGTIAACREHGYAETVTGRRRYLRDIASANATVRGAAERNAINMPVQGTAADMIKLAMARIHGELGRRKLKSRLLLQVHDELVFDVWLPERDEVSALVEERMRTALELGVPIEVEVGVGNNWLEAH